MSKANITVTITAGKPKKHKKQPKLEVWKGASGRWWWHLRAANGLIICDGSQGYTTKWSAMRGALRVQAIMSRAVPGEEVFIEHV